MIDSIYYLDVGLTFSAPICNCRTKHVIQTDLFNRGVCKYVHVVFISARAFAMCLCILVQMPKGNICSESKKGGKSVETTPGLQLNHLFNNEGSCLSHTPNTA